MKHPIHKIAICVVLAAPASFFWSATSFAKTEPDQTVIASSADKIVAATKHKILKDKIRPIASEAADIESDTHKAIIALEKKDSKNATAILQGISGKLDSLLAKNPGLALVPANVEADVFDFEGDNNTVKKALVESDRLLESGRLQTARQILTPLASEIRVNTTSVPLGTFPAAIKKSIALIEEGKLDQATVDLDNLLDTLEVTTEIMPLPVLRAEELLTVASELEHSDDLSKEQNRQEIKALTDAAKDKLELAQLLGYGNEDDYKILYDSIDGINTALFTEKSAEAWQAVKDKFSAFKNNLTALSDAAYRVGHPAK